MNGQFTVTGEIREIFPMKMGEGQHGLWKRQSLIIEIEDNPDMLLYLSAFGEKANEASFFRIGDRVKAHFNISSKNVRDSWRHDIQVYRWELLEENIGKEYLIKSNL